MHVDRPTFKEVVRSALLQVHAVVEAEWDEDGLTVRMEDTTVFLLDLRPGETFLDGLGDRLTEKMAARKADGVERHYF